VQEDATGARVDQALGTGAAALPGDVIVRLPDVTAAFTVTAVGQSAQGAPLTAVARATSVEHQAVDVTVALGDFFGAPRCPGSAAILCDDFESGSIDPARWPSADTQNGQPAIDGGHAARGTHSLHLTGNTDGSGSHVATALIHNEATGLPSPVFIRAFFYADEIALGDTEVITSLQALGNSNSGVQIESSALGNFRLDGWGVALTSRESGVPVPTGRWVCLEWAVTVGSPGAMSLWLDDVPVADLQQQPWMTPPAFDGPRLGLEYTPPSSSATLDLWVDEVVVAGARIGCSR
jgi:hypothetical protein